MILFYFLLYSCRRSPRNIESDTHNRNADIKGIKKFVPSNITVNTSNFKFSQGITNRKVNQQTTIASPRKPFAFSGKEKLQPNKSENILSNITNSPHLNKHTSNSLHINQKSVKSSLPYKPYTGKVGQWNPKKTMEERRALANKTALKSKKEEIIKGVRLNKRAELLMKKRGINAEN